MLNLAFTDSVVVFGDGSSDVPSFSDDWFPYGGYFYIRSGWERDDHFMFLKSSRAIGHAGPWRWWENNNALPIYGFGEELLFLHRETPLRIDGYGQNSRHGLTLNGHVGYVLSPPTVPKQAQARWHSSAVFAFSEGTYGEPYGEIGQHVIDRMSGLDSSKGAAITGVAHTRQVFLLQQEGLWVIVDRVRSGDPHDYSQKWMLHVPEHDGFGPIHGVAPGEVRIDGEGQSISTASPDEPNFTLYHVGPAPVAYSSKLAPPNGKRIEIWTSRGRDPEYVEPGNYVLAFTVSRIDASSHGNGD